MTVPGLGWICQNVDYIKAFGTYTVFVQDHLAQANYFRDPTKLSEYRKECHFLPYINNEATTGKNATYKSNFVNLNKLVLVMAEGDSVVHPKESEHFGFYEDESTTKLVA